MRIRLTVPKAKSCWPSACIDGTWFIFVNQTDWALRELLEPGTYAVVTSRKPGFRRLAELDPRALEASMYIYRPEKAPHIKLAFCKSTFDTVFPVPPADLYVRRLSKPKQ